MRSRRPIEVNEFRFSLRHDWNDLDFDFVAVLHRLKASFHHVVPACLHHHQLRTVKPNRDFHWLARFLDLAFAPRRIALEIGELASVLGSRNVKHIAIEGQHPVGMAAVVAVRLPSPGQLSTVSAVGPQAGGAKEETYCYDQTS